MSRSIRPGRRKPAPKRAGPGPLDKLIGSPKQDIYQDLAAALLVAFQDGKVSKDMAGMVSERLPSYEDSIKLQEPPQYSLVASSSLQCPCRQLYQTDPLQLVSITGDGNVDSVDPETISFSVYETTTTQEIYDTYKAVTLVMEEKVQQISRNIEFLRKKLRTQRRNYYIDRLRDETCADFSTIKGRILNEAEILQRIFTLIAHHNALYEDLDSHLLVLQHQMASTSAKKEYAPLEQQYNSQLLRRSQCVKNLELLQMKVREFACTDDVSYVLKERARIYNDAKEVVRRQTRN